MGEEHKHLKVSQQAVIRNASGEVLILRQADGAIWLLPGGRMEGNEGITDSLRREVREETGMEIEIGEPVAVDISETHSTYAIAFLCTVRSADPVLSDEHTELRWVAPDELPNYLWYKKIAETLAKKLQ